MLRRGRRDTVSLRQVLGARGQRLCDRIEAVRQRGWAGLQDQRRFDLDDAAVLYGRNLLPPRTLCDPLPVDLLAASRGENQIGRGRNHRIGGDDTVLGGLLCPQSRKGVLAASDLN
jgi:hypothetical protein